MDADKFGDTEHGRWLASLALNGGLVCLFGYVLFAIKSDYDYISCFKVAGHPSLRSIGTRKVTMTEYYIINLGGL